MWWQLLPSAAICYICVAGPAAFVYASTYWYTGGGGIYGRDLDTRFQRHKFMRDERILGHDGLFMKLGLDGVPDD